MSEMVERVARAINAEHARIEALPRHERASVDRNLGEMLAKVAIEAMREPTDEMLGAVYGLCGEQRGSDRAAREVWQAMLDEALK